jgi:hypothetical protein
LLSQRSIRLRRPPTLSVQDGVYVPAAPKGFDSGETRLLDEIERRWESLRAANPAYFDGRLCHVIGVHRNGHGGAVLHVIDCAYRFFAVQRKDFDLGVRPLGVKGVIERDGKFLMGRRSARVAMYANMWEFAPSGSVDFGRAPHEVIDHELHEETGLLCEGEPMSIAILLDPVLQCWEIVYRLNIAANAQPHVTNEYPAIEWFSREGFPPHMSPIALQIVDLL